MSRKTGSVPDQYLHISAHTHRFPLPFTFKIDSNPRTLKPSDGREDAPFEVTPTFTFLRETRPIDATKVKQWCSVQIQPPEIDQLRYLMQDKDVRLWISTNSKLLGDPPADYQRYCSFELLVADGRSGRDGDPVQVALLGVSPDTPA